MNYLENLKVLRDAVAAEPEQLFDLSMYEVKKDCGTLHCSAGLACTLPFFQQQGLRMSDDLMPTAEVPVDTPGMTHLERALNHFFHPGVEVTEQRGAFDYLFTPYGTGDWDDLLTNLPYDLTHKQLALARLDRAIQYWEERQHG